MLNVKLQELQNYEAGDLSPEEIVDLFQRLVDGGLVNALPRRYRKIADALAEAGLIERPITPIPQEA
jgi:hypothetical protein